MIRRIIPEEIDLQLNVSPLEDDENLMIRGSRDQIEQIMLNLASNARDSISKDGKIKIEISYNSHEDKHVTLSIKDNGSGIPQEIQDKIYDPFFTTKGIGDGTGLGLSTVYGIIKQHNAKIQVVSSVEAPTGTTFLLHFPKYKNKK